MKKVINPFAGKEGFHCFGCSPSNPIGLQLEFIDEGEYIVCRWDPRPEFQGYHNVLHGGIQATLMDEIASWTIYTKADTAGVTARMNISYKKPVPVNKGSLVLKAKIKEAKRKIIRVEVSLYDPSDTLCAFADVDYFVYSPEQAKEKLFYPGKPSFYE